MCNENKIAVFSGYFIVDDKSDPLDPVKQKKPGLRREQSMSSIGSGAGDERSSRTLARQSSRSRMVRQQSRGSLRRPDSSSRVQERDKSTSRATERKVSVTAGDCYRDVYVDNKNAWKNSLRGASR